MKVGKEAHFLVYKESNVVSEIRSAQVFNYI